MDTKVGKIKSYNKGMGEIESDKNTYRFLDKDLIPKDNQESYNLNEEVLFRGEKVQGINRAFFVRKPKNEEEVKKYIIHK